MFKLLVSLFILIAASSCVVAAQYNDSQTYLRPDPYWFQRLRTIEIATSFDEGTFARIGSMYEPTAFYKLFPFVFQATSADHINGFNYTYKKPIISMVTPTSIDRVHRLIPMVESWKSSMSVAVLVVGNIGLCHAFISKLRECNAAIAQYVDFHFVFADSNGKTEYGDLDLHLPLPFDELVLKSNSFFENSSCQAMTRHGILRLQKATSIIHDGLARHPLPVNLLRNVARMHARFSYVMMCDVGAIPSANLAREFERAYRDYVNDEFPRNATATAFVVPGLPTLFFEFL
jgi:hypothetical protein